MIKARDLQLAIKACVTANKPLIVKGPPGVGKTAIIEGTVEDLGLPLIPMYLSTMTRTDTTGHPVYDRENQQAKFLPYGNLEIMINATEDTVVLFDDFGQAPQSVQAGCMHLLSERRIGFNKISDKVHFLLATNDKGQYAGTNGILEPVKSRAVSIVELEADLDSWVHYAMKKGLREEVIGFVRLKPEMLWNFTPTADLVNSPSPRTNEHVSDILNMNLPDKLEQEMIAGAVGQGYAVEFYGFKRLYQNMALPEEILKDPEGFELDMTQPDLLHAYCTAIAHIANRDNLDAVGLFANRLPPEYGFKLMEHDIHVKESYRQTKAYINWAIKNQDLLQTN